MKPKHSVINNEKESTIHTYRIGIFFRISEKYGDYKLHQIVYLSRTFRVNNPKSPNAMKFGRHTW